MKVPLTQSKEWQKLQDDLGEKSHYFEGDGFRFLAIEKSTPVGKYLYLPYGPVSHDQGSFRRAIKSLVKLAKTTSAVFIRVEPTEPYAADILRRGGNLAQGIKAIKKTKDLNPADTWVLDLTPDEATLKSGFSQGTRTRYNNYSKKGLSVHLSDNPADLSHLIALQRKLYHKKHLKTFSEDYLQTELAQPFASLYLVNYQTGNDQTREAFARPDDGQYLAASLFFDYDGVRYYMQSAADQEFKRLPATVALLSRAIFDAKAKGLREFDFWGIAPENASLDHPWLGFTEFKKSFGGEPRHYAGDYDLILHPAKYKLYQLLRKIRSLI